MFDCCCVWFDCACWILFDFVVVFGCCFVGGVYVCVVYC